MQPLGHCLPEDVSERLPVAVEHAGRKADTAIRCSLLARRELQAVLVDSTPSRWQRSVLETLPALEPRQKAARPPTLLTNHDDYGLSCGTDGAGFLQLADRSVDLVHQLPRASAELFDALSTLFAQIQQDGRRSAGNLGMRGGGLGFRRRCGCCRRHGFPAYQLNSLERSYSFRPLVADLDKLRGRSRSHPSRRLRDDFL